jgi:hypothetical protein
VQAAGSRGSGSGLGAVGAGQADLRLHGRCQRCSGGSGRGGRGGGWQGLATASVVPA